MAELLQRKQCEVQLLQREQPMAELLQGKQHEVQLLQEEQPMAGLLQGKQHEVQLPQEEQPMAELPQGKQHEVQLLQKEQPMAEWTQGEQQRTKLLQGKQYEVQLPQREQPMAELLQGKQHEVQLLQGRQYKMQLLQEDQPVEEWTQGEQLAAGSAQCPNFVLCKFFTLLIFSLLRLVSFIYTVMNTSLEFLQQRVFLFVYSSDLTCLLHFSKYSPKAWKGRFSLKLSCVIVLPRNVTITSLRLVRPMSFLIFARRRRNRSVFLTIHGKRLKSND
jgi:hypothetical protein